MADRPPISPVDMATARLAAIVESSDDAIVSKTLDGIITSWNQAAERMFGYTAEEAIGRPITLIIPSERLDEETEVLRRVRQGDRVDHFETVRRRKDGDLVPISLTVSPIRDTDGSVIGASKIARDITDRLRADAERDLLLSRERTARNESEKANRIKDEFLATLSHELRTPLNAMLGWVRMLRMGRFDGGTAERALDTIERNTRLLARLVEDVLDVSRITTGTMLLDPKSVGLVPIIEAAVESMRPAARAKAIQVGLFLDPATARINGDPARLQQIVWNLVSNAIKFTNRGGRVEIHLLQAGSHVELRVVDTGRGIAPAFLPRVFDRFTQADSSSTRSYGGLGLGLAIVRHLVELHGGEVRASSEGEGRGSTFTVRFPVSAVAHAAAPTDPGRPSSVTLHGVRVLVLDDNSDARELLRAVLMDNDAIVMTAGSVDEAVSALTWQAPHVVLCDISMPGRDGYEFAREARRLRGDAVPIIAVTAYARAEERDRLLREGFSAHIPKPVDPFDLIREVARVVGMPR